LILPASFSIPNRIRVRFLLDFTRNLKIEGVMETSISASSAAAITHSSAPQTSTTKSTPTLDDVEKRIGNTVETAAVQHKAPDMKTLKVLVNEANKLIKTVSSNLQFQIDDSTKQVVVKIVDTNTGDVIRQIPTVEMLDFIRQMKKLEGNAGALLQAVA